MAQAIDGRVYAEIRNGKAHWIFTAEDLPEWAEGAGEFEIQTVDITDLSPQPKEGWDFDGKAFTPPAKLPIPVPQEVTRFQALAALYQAGKLEQVEAIMARPETSMLTKLAWQNALVFKRQSPLVLALGEVLGLSTEDLDNLFIQASQIE